MPKMNIIDKIAKWFGYIKIPNENDITISKTIYKKNGVWYGIYDNIIKENLNTEEKNALEKEQEIYFRLSPTEWERLKTFKIELKYKYDSKHNLNKPDFWIGFSSGGGIGKCVYVKDEQSGIIYDITDINTW